MKSVIFILSAVSAMVLEAALPAISEVRLYQPKGQRKVKIDYKLSAPAVVTMDIETNSPAGGWVSIGVDAIYRPGFFPSGDVNKIVKEESASITWKPELGWLEEIGGISGARAVLRAWPLDDKPPYMVVDISLGKASADRVRYYQSEEFVPGGVLGNTDYRLNKLLLKKVIAKGIPWTMGSVLEFGRQANETAHRVVLDHNYYLGVFPVTRKQCALLMGTENPSGIFAVDGEMRIRAGVDYWKKEAYQLNLRGQSFYPDAPTEDSILGRLRLNVENTVDFDLPGEAEWEYACRAGTVEGYWNTGDKIEARNASESSEDNFLPGRYKYNQVDSATGPTSGDSGTNCGPESGSPIAGTYEPNNWGFYDMHGGVWERCLDWYQDDITALNGRINSDGANTLGGTAGVDHVVRGGSYYKVASDCRSSRRQHVGPSYWGDAQDIGFRVACRAGLK